MTTGEDLEALTTSLEFEVKSPMEAAGGAAAGVAEVMQRAAREVVTRVGSGARSDVFRKVIRFVAVFRDWAEHSGHQDGLFGNEWSQEAAEIVDILERHCRLAEFFEKTEQVRLQRDLTVVNAELDTLYKSGDEARKRAAKFLEEAAAALDMSL